MSVWFTDPPPGAPAPERRPTGPDAQRVQAIKRRRRIVTAGLSLLMLIGLGAATVFVVLPFIESLRPVPEEVIADYPGPGWGSVNVVVRPGDGGAAIGETLADADVVATSEVFTDAYSANPHAMGIQPGTYALPQQMHASDAVAALLDPANRVVVRFTIPEGFRAQQVYERISEATGLSVASLAAAAQNGSDIGLPEEAEGDVEGWLFPATYELDPDPTPVQALSPMVAKMIDVLETAGAPPEEWRDTIILASMVEKEAKLDSDRPKVARVFLNRLDQDMLLQSDATVAYGADDYSSVFTSDEDRADDNAYNTYVTPGLPAGPICNPGEAAIAAALSPEKGDWMYFVTVNLDTGETAYAEDAYGHEQNVQKLRDWMEENPGDY